MGETTQTDGPCGHDGRDFTAYSMNDLDGTEARSVETEAACGCQKRCTCHATC